MVNVGSVLLSSIATSEGQQPQSTDGQKGEGGGFGDWLVEYVPPADEFQIVETQYARVVGMRSKDSDIVKQSINRRITSKT